MQEQPCYFAKHSTHIPPASHPLFLLYKTVETLSLAFIKQSLFSTFLLHAQVFSLLQKEHLLLSLSLLPQLVIQSHIHVHQSHILMSHFRAFSVNQDEVEQYNCRILNTGISKSLL